jgi:tRNA G18 (ribose-2'-O)-methylase SpoU
MQNITVGVKVKKPSKQQRKEIKKNQIIHTISPTEVLKKKIIAEMMRKSESKSVESFVESHLFNSSELAKVGEKKHNVEFMHRDLIYSKNLIYTQRFCLPIACMMVRLDGHLNAGSIIRNSAAFGFQKVALVECSKINLRGAVGSQNYITVDRLSKINQVVDYFRENNFSPIFIEQGGKNLDRQNIAAIMNTFKKGNQNEQKGQVKTMKPILILGSESFGICPEMFQLFPHAPILSISQVGIIKSLNVAAAAAIAMHAFQQFYQESLCI